MYDNQFEGGLPAYFDDPLTFHVYSQGQPSDFGDLEQFASSNSSDVQLKWHLNENAIQSISDMISADVFVMAKSSFSYIPAAFSQGTIMYQDF